MYYVSLFSSLGNAEQMVGVPFNCFKESWLTIADHPSLSVSDLKRSRSLLSNGEFLSVLLLLLFFLLYFPFLQNSALQLARNMAVDS